jgi:Na+-transporting NADH:ubiquinone oxidoreductase subunit F
VLHKGGVLIPAACGGSGTCGLCRVTVTGEGAGEPQATERGVLSRASGATMCAWPARRACAAIAPSRCPTTS